MLQKFLDLVRNVVFESYNDANIKCCPLVLIFVYVKYLNDVKYLHNDCVFMMNFYLMNVNLHMNNF